MDLAELLASVLSRLLQSRDPRAWASAATQELEHEARLTLQAYWSTRDDRSEG